MPRYADFRRRRLQKELVLNVRKLSLQRLGPPVRPSLVRRYKPFGFEVLDLRYGGLRARLETMHKRLIAYLDVEDDSVTDIPELEVELEVSSPPSRGRGRGGVSDTFRADDLPGSGTQFDAGLRTGVSAAIHLGDRCRMGLCESLPSGRCAAAWGPWSYSGCFAFIRLYKENRERTQIESVRCEKMWAWIEAPGGPEQAQSGSVSPVVEAASREVLAA